MRTMSERKVYLDFSPDLRQALESSKLSMQEVIERYGVDVPASFARAELPGGTEEERGRNVAWEVVFSPEMVLSLATAVSMIVLAVSKFLRDRARDPRISTLVEKTVTGSDGKSQRVLVPEQVIIEPAAVESATEIEANKFGVKEGMVFRFSTTEKPKG